MRSSKQNHELLPDESHHKFHLLIMEHVSLQGKDVDDFLQQLQPYMGRFGKQTFYTVTALSTNQIWPCH